MRKRKLLACLLAVGMMMSLIPSALAAETSIDDAAASVNLAQVEQALDRATGTDVAMTKDKISHDYRTQGEIDTVSYQAKLTMTKTMADYLYAREKQLMDARFVVKIDIDVDKLDFVTNTDGSADFTFKSTFLKAVDDGSQKYSVTKVEVKTEGGYTWFVSTIHVPNVNSLSKADLKYAAELVLYTDQEKTVVSASDIKAGYEEDTVYDSFARSIYGDKATLSYNMTDAAWTQPITLELAKLKLTDETVTKGKQASASSPYAIKATGTISGTFDYATAEVMENIGDFTHTYKDESLYKTMGYGGMDASGNYQGWTANTVELDLYSSTSGGGGGGGSKPVLNKEDHFGYIIGYPVDYYTGEPTTDQTKKPVRPQGNITRAEVATIFFRMLTDESRTEFWSQTNSYSDVKQGQWFNPAISTLSNAGIISGYPDGSFQPNGYITRAEFATIAVRFFDVQYDGKDLFPDISTHWAKDYINQAGSAGLVNGYPDGTFGPNRYITRAEAVTLVNRTLDRHPDQEHFLSDMLVWPDNMDTTKWYYADMQEATNSHEYEMKTASDGTKYEVWTKMLPIRDWEAFEKAWSDAGSATNPGEVVKPSTSK